MAHTAEQVSRLFHLPLLELIERAHAVHASHQAADQVQLCHLLSIKTGGCPEDCAYCPQSARYDTGVEVGKLLERDEVLSEATRARAGGATRFCMGAAWRQVKDGPEFDRVLDMVRGVADLGMEVCCTLGMLTGDQAQRLAQAGLTAYNHNLDTSPEFYGQIITTRTYEDRLRTLENVRAAGITVCCGGILGLGENENDRIRLLTTLANLNPPPESVPINALVAVEGTPLAQQKPVAPFEFVRAIATARILMPQSKVRLSAGRLSLSPEAQALCFYSGANSIFVGDKLLTTPNPDEDADRALLRELGLEGEAAKTSCQLPVASGQRTQAPAIQLQQEWISELEQLQAKRRKRELRENRGEDFCSNDYLGLANHPAVRAAMERALRDGLDLGSTGSRLVRGNHPAFEALERRFADWRGAEAALFFSSGYAAGLGVLTALIGPKDIVFSDAANHASLIDGLRLSGARRVVFPHNDAAALRAALLRHPAASGSKRFLVIESLYSMEGDRAPAAEMAELCRAHGVAMIVDEAHATGLYPAVDLSDVVIAGLHPCGKALGGSGCLVAGSRLLREYLVNRCRSFIFSTAPSPLLAVQLTAALEVIEREPERREQVLALARALRRGLGMGDATSPIVPLIVGSDEDALTAAAELAAQGFDVRAIRPPTVPEGTARLRLTVHAGQTPDSIAKLCRAASSRVLTPA